MPAVPVARDAGKFLGRSRGPATAGVMPTITRNRPRSTSSSQTGLAWPDTAPSSSLVHDLGSGSSWSDSAVSVTAPRTGSWDFSWWAWGTTADDAVDVWIESGAARDPGGELDRRSIALGGFTMSGSVRLTLNATTEVTAQLLGGGSATAVSLYVEIFRIGDAP